MLAPIPRPLLHGHPVNPWAASVLLHAPQGRKEIPPLHDPFHQARIPHQSVPSRCSNRGFTPPLRAGPLELLCRCVASVHHPLNPPALRSGLLPTRASLLCLLLTSACRSAGISPLSVRVMAAG